MIKASTTVTAISDFECIAIDFSQCMAELRTNLVLSNKLGAALAVKLAQSTENLASYTLYTGEQRLCSYIIQVSHSEIFRDILTYVACSISVSYRHLLCMLHQLYAESILEKREDGFLIQDHEMLMKHSCR